MNRHRHFEAKDWHERYLFDALFDALVHLPERGVNVGSALQPLMTSIR
jgi:hypothetical protein